MKMGRMTKWFIIFVLIAFGFYGLAYLKSSSEGCQYGYQSFNNVNCFPIYQAVCSIPSNASTVFGQRYSFDSLTGLTTVNYQDCGNSTCSYGFCQSKVLIPEVSYISEYLQAYWNAYLR